VRQVLDSTLGLKHASLFQAQSNWDNKQKQSKMRKNKKTKNESNVRDFHTNMFVAACQLNKG